MVLKMGAYPFITGKGPIRRTVKYLKQGKLIFRDQVKIVVAHYNYDRAPYQQGLADFMFWKGPQIQFKNPHLQVFKLSNMFPTPFIRCWMENGEDVIVDVFNKSMEEIEEHMIRILGKSEAQLEEEKEEQRLINNPAYFGAQSLRHCICEVPGQMPCPAYTDMPEAFKGKNMVKKMLANRE